MHTIAFIVPGISFPPDVGDVDRPPTSMADAAYVCAFAGIIAAVTTGLLHASLD